MTTLFQYIATIFFAGLISSIGACTSTQSDQGDQAVSSSKNVSINLVSKDTGELLSEFSGTDDVSAVMTALDNRERRYEKLMPLFEYKLDVTKDGDRQTWYVNKAGYLRKSDSSDLYKMDVSSVFK